MPRSVASLLLSSDQYSEIQRWLAALGTLQQVALRSRIVLALASGKTELAVAAEHDVNRKTVRLWRERFRTGGLQALWEIAPGRGRKPTYDVQRIKAVVDATLQSKPKGSTHWSCRTMAAAHGMSKSTVSKIWRSHNLKPHRSDTFKLSRDPRFLEKLTDVVGLYLNPPDNAIVLCVDEKSQIQALQRTQPGLPLQQGRCGTMTHDYQRHGTTTLFAALDVLAGKVIGDCYKRHRHQEFLKFLRRVDRAFPGDVPLHLVMDNYSTHGTLEVKAWLQRHPRFRVHSIPTSSSWLNLMERWFAQLTSKRIRRDSFLSVEDLIAAINEFLVAWNEKPKPFVWTGHRRIHRGQTRTLPTNHGADPARLHCPKDAKTKGQLIRGRYTSLKGAIGGFFGGPCYWPCAPVAVRNPPWCEARTVPTLTSSFSVTIAAECPLAAWQTLGSTGRAQAPGSQANMGRCRSSPMPAGRCAGTAWHRTGSPPTRSASCCRCC
jgi:transposase